MTQKRTLVLGVVGAMVVAGIALGIALARGESTQTDDVTRVEQLRSNVVESAALVGGGPIEGITVHGHWVIEVRDPDGTLVERREFENALSSAATITGLLARDHSAGLWEVQLRASVSSAAPCQTSAGTSSHCHVVESASSVSDAKFSKTLTISHGFGDFVLTGTATAQKSGEVGVVRTGMSRCATPVAPDSPCEATYFTFTPNPPKDVLGDSP